MAGDTPWTSTPHQPRSSFWLPWRVSSELPSESTEEASSGRGASHRHDTQARAGLKLGPVRLGGHAMGELVTEHRANDWTHGKAEDEARVAPGGDADACSRRRARQGSEECR